MTEDLVISGSPKQRAGQRMNGLELGHGVMFSLGGCRTWNREVPLVQQVVCLLSCRWQDPTLGTSLRKGSVAVVKVLGTRIAAGRIRPGGAAPVLGVDAPRRELERFRTAEKLATFAFPHLDEVKLGEGTGPNGRNRWWAGDSVLGGVDEYIYQLPLPCPFARRPSFMTLC